MKKKVIFIALMLLFKEMISEPKACVIALQKKPSTTKLRSSKPDSHYSKLLSQENRELNQQLAQLIQSSSNYAIAQRKRLNAGRLLLHGNTEYQTKQADLMQKCHDFISALQSLNVKVGDLLHPVSAELTRAQYLDESAKSVKLAKEVTDYIEHVSSQI